MNKNLVDKQKILDKINKICFSEEWKRFRTDYGSHGQRDAIINFIKDLPPEQISNIEDNKDDVYKILYITDDNDGYGPYTAYECSGCYAKVKSFDRYCHQCGHPFGEKINKSQEGRE